MALNNESLFTIRVLYCSVGRNSEALSTFAALAKLDPEASTVQSSLDFYRSQTPESNWTLNEVQP